MFKITAVRTHIMAQPHAAWSLVPGANHFDEAMPEAVATQLRALQAQDAVVVHNIDDDGVATPW